MGANGSWVVSVHHNGVITARVPPPPDPRAEHSERIWDLDLFEYDVSDDDEKSLPQQKKPAQADLNAEPKHPKTGE